MTTASSASPTQHPDHIVVNYVPPARNLRRTIYKCHLEIFYKRQSTINIFVECEVRILLSLVLSSLH